LIHSYFTCAYFHFNYDFTCSCPGSHSFYLIQIGWEEKFITEIQKGIRMKWSCMIKESEKVHLVCC
jgi:hypothetical protein